MDNELEFEIKALIIDALELEDISPSDIDSEEPLFDGGLGLDSIDALELGVAIAKRYGLKIDGESQETPEHFASVKNLVAFIQSKSKGKDG